MLNAHDSVTVYTSRVYIQFEVIRAANWRAYCWSALFTGIALHNVVGRRVVHTLIADSEAKFIIDRNVTLQLTFMSVLYLL